MLVGTSIGHSGFVSQSSLTTTSMPILQFLKLYAAAATVFFALDIAWLGYVAKGIYAEQMGHLTRADV